MNNLHNPPRRLTPKEIFEAIEKTDTDDPFCVWFENFWCTELDNLLEKTKSDFDVLGWLQLAFQGGCRSGWLYPAAESGKMTPMNNDTPTYRTFDESVKLVNTDGPVKNPSPGLQAAAEKVKEKMLHVPAQKLEPALSGKQGEFKGNSGHFTLDVTAGYDRSLGCVRLMRHTRLESPQGVEMSDLAFMSLLIDTAKIGRASCRERV